jgi:hypothetical protein
LVVGAPLKGWSTMYADAGVTQCNGGEKSGNERSLGIGGTIFVGQQVVVIDMEVVRAWSARMTSTQLPPDL